MVMAMITFCREARVSAISAMASRMVGMDMKPSMIRITTASTQRTKPAARPISTPMTVDSAATVKPTISETRAP